MHDLLNRPHGFSDADEASRLRELAAHRIALRSLGAAQVAEWCAAHETLKAAAAKPPELRDDLDATLPELREALDTFLAIDDRMHVHVQAARWT